MAFIETQGTQLQLNDEASPNVFTLIPKITNISGFGSGGRTEIDTTSLDSTAKEFQMGLKDNGSLTLDIVWDERLANHAALRTAFDATPQVTKNFQIVDTGSPQKTYNFNAYVQSIPIDWTGDEVVRAGVTLRISGDPVIT